MKRGFTIFELLVVMAVISISLMVVLGAYSSWATVHALNGAVRTLEAGLLQARATAKAKNTYVKFVYETSGLSSNSVKLVSGFQSFICTNSADRSIITSALEQYSTEPAGAAGNDITNENSAFSRQFVPLASAQWLTGHVELQSVGESAFNADPNGFQTSGNGSTIIFCPDGSAWSWNDVSAHHLVVLTRKQFARDGPSEPIFRVMRINLATGTVSVFRPQ